jgi:uncharacterized protein (DUF2345 family)
MMIVGGVAFAYTTGLPASNGGTGRMSNGTLAVEYPSTEAAIVLDAPQQVTMVLTASGQMIRVKHVKVEAASTGLWDIRCGDRVRDFAGVDADLPAPVDVKPDTPFTLDRTNASNIKVTLKNDRAINQSSCTLRLKVTVSS